MRKERKMGFFDRFTGKAKREEEARLAAEAEKQRKAEERKAKRDSKKAASAKTQTDNLTAKEKATLAGEPYVNILGMEVNPDDINSGAFELDWNEKFVLNLIRAGYKFKDSDTDQVIVERWFQTICRNVALEVYEQEQADPDNRYRAEMRVVRNKDLGDGLTEVS